MLAVVPTFVLSAAITSKAAAAATARQEVVDARASAVMSELFGAIRTVAAFTGEQRAFNSYIDVATTADKAGMFVKVLQKSGFGCVMCCVFGMYALVLWYGTVLIRHRVMNGGTVMTVRGFRARAHACAATTCQEPAAAHARAPRRCSSAS